jgi:hypothetical protein
MKERLRMRGFILPETEAEDVLGVEEDAEAPFDGDEEA